MIIVPTVGRKVWYRPSASDKLGPVPMQCALDHPLDATIIAVWGDRMVNVLVTDIGGRQFPVLSCTLIQAGDFIPVLVDDKSGGRYVEWMPYQAGQAAKQVTPPLTGSMRGYLDYVPCADLIKDSTLFGLGQLS